MKATVTTKVTEDNLRNLKLDFFKRTSKKALLKHIHRKCGIYTKPKYDKVKITTWEDPATLIINVRASVDYSLPVTSRPVYVINNEDYKGSALWLQQQAFLAGIYLPRKWIRENPNARIL